MDLKKKRTYHILNISWLKSLLRNVTIENKLKDVKIIYVYKPWQNEEK